MTIAVDLGRKATKQTNKSIFLYRSWLDKNPQLLSMTVYTYLRVIIDHNNQMFHSLRQREGEFISAVLRERVRN